MNTSILRDLQLSQDWFNLGVISPAQLEELGAKWRTGEDQNPEHYRWRAFQDFLRTRTVLEPNLVGQLYQLGANDPDPGMGGSMMAELLQRDDCPVEILKLACSMGPRFLVKIASRRLETMQASNVKNGDV